MLKQQQAKLLDRVYAIVVNKLGTKCAEDFLQHMLAEDCVSRSQLTSYISDFIDDPEYVNIHLGRSLDSSDWLGALDDFVMDRVSKHYNEVKQWRVIKRLQ